jgi:hypothetical protein
LLQFDWIIISSKITKSNENRNYHPYLGKRNNNIIYFYEVTTTSMFNFTKTPMKSEQTGQSFEGGKDAEVR